MGSVCLASSLSRPVGGVACNQMGGEDDHRTRPRSLDHAGPLVLPEQGGAAQRASKREEHKRETAHDAGRGKTPRRCCWMRRGGSGRLGWRRGVLAGERGRLARARAGGCVERGFGQSADLNDSEAERGLDSQEGVHTPAVGPRGWRCAPIALGEGGARRPRPLSLVPVGGRWLVLAPCCSSAVLGGGLRRTERRSSDRHQSGESGVWREERVPLFLPLLCALLGANQGEQGWRALCLRGGRYPGNGSHTHAPQRGRAFEGFEKAQTRPTQRTCKGEGQGLSDSRALSGDPGCHPVVGEWFPCPRIVL